jgi:hypothetical protein
VVNNPPVCVVERVKGSPFPAFNALPGGFFTHNRPRQIIENALQDPEKQNASKLAGVSGYMDVWFSEYRLN